MKTLLLIFTLIVGMVAFAQGDKNFIDQNYIEVTGKSELQIVPDKIFTKVILSDRDFKNKSLTQVEQEMIAEMKAIGLDISKDFFIKDFAGVLQRRTFSKEVVVTKEYTVITHNGKSTVELFNRFEKLGISNMNIVKFESSKIDEYVKEAKIRAIKAARDKANYLTETIGQKAGRAIHIIEDNWVMSPQLNNANIAVQKLERDDLSEMEFENIVVKAGVTCKFELK